MKKIKTLVESLIDYSFKRDDSYSSRYQKVNLLPLISNILDAQLLPRSAYKNVFDRNFKELSRYSHTSNQELEKIYQKIRDNIEYFNNLVGFTE